MEYRGSIDSNEDIASRGIINDMLVIRLTGTIPTDSTIYQSTLNGIGLTFDKMKSLAQGKYIGVIDTNGTLYSMSGGQYTSDYSLRVILRFGDYHIDAVEIYDLSYNGSYWSNYHYEI